MQVCDLICSSSRISVEHALYRHSPDSPSDRISFGSDNLTCQLYLASRLLIDRGSRSAPLMGSWHLCGLGESNALNWHILGCGWSASSPGRVRMRDSALKSRFGSEIPRFYDEDPKSLGKSDPVWGTYQVCLSLKAMAKGVLARLMPVNYREPPL